MSGNGPVGRPSLQDLLNEAMKLPATPVRQPGQNAPPGRTGRSSYRTLVFYVTIVLLILTLIAGLYYGIGVAVHAIAGPTGAGGDTPNQHPQSNAPSQPVYNPPSAAYPTMPPTPTPTPLPPTPIPTPDDGTITQMITTYFNSQHYHNEGPYVGDDYVMDVIIQNEQEKGNQLAVCADIYYGFSEGAAGFGEDNRTFLFLFAYGGGAWSIKKMEVATSDIVDC